MSPSRILRNRATRACVTRQRCTRIKRTAVEPIGEFGPPPPPIPEIDSDGAGPYDIADDGKPMWLKDLERDVDYDPEVRQLLESGSGDPEAVRARMNQYMEDAAEYPIRTKTGRPEPIQVSFREYDPAVAYV